MPLCCSELCLTFGRTNNHLMRYHEHAYLQLANLYYPTATCDQMHVREPERQNFPLITQLHLREYRSAEVSVQLAPFSSQLTLRSHALPESTVKKRVWLLTGAVSNG